MGSADHRLTRAFIGRTLVRSKPAHLVNSAPASTVGQFGAKFNIPPVSRGLSRLGGRESPPRGPNAPQPIGPGACACTTLYPRGIATPYRDGGAARTARRGLWADRKPLPPWEHRKAGRAKLPAPLLCVEEDSSRSTPMNICHTTPACPHYWFQ